MHFVDALLKAFDLFTKRLEHNVDAGLAGIGEGLPLFLEDLVGKVLEFLGEGLPGLAKLL